MVARIGVTLLELYVLAGLILAPWIVWRGLDRLDPHAIESGWGFRLMVAPGVVAFWPLLAQRLWRGVSTPPDERNAHRLAARERRS